MTRIADETEGWLRPQGFQEPLPPLTPSNAEIIADAAYRAARSAGVAAIVVYTSSGASARLDLPPPSVRPPFTRLRRAKASRGS